MKRYFAFPSHFFFFLFFFINFPCIIYIVRIADPGSPSHDNCSVRQVLEVRKYIFVVNKEFLPEEAQYLKTKEGHTYLS